MEFEVVVGADLVAAFAQATGDFSSIHMDPQFARKTRFRGQIVHGMLPLLLLLSRACYNWQAGHGARIAEIACRFASPLRIGERIRCAAAAQAVDGGAGSWSLAITRAVDGTLVTSAKVRMVVARPHGVTGLPTESLLAQRPEEARYTAADITEGLTEKLAFTAEPSAFADLFRSGDAQLGGAGNGDFADRNACALACLSTLIGMRLPGQHATFQEFEAHFPQTVEGPDDVTLIGTVTKLFPSASRIEVGLTWTQGARVVGSGVALTMIGDVLRSGPSCEVIRAEHLGTGLAGRVALVTGASRGIGEASAKMLAMHGARVGVHYFHGADDAAVIVSDIRDNGGEALAVQADLADRASIIKMFRTIETELGPIDILVNNAVVDFLPKPQQELRSDDFIAELDVSLLGMHACCNLALPHMRRQRWGKIINMGTVATDQPVKSQGKYIAAKSAVIGYTRSLAVEATDDNVQVNMVVPGMTETSLLVALPKSLRDRLAEDNPGGTLLAPVDVAKVIVFLASNWAASISGQRILVTRGAPPFA